MRKHKAAQFMFAAVEPSGWILRWTMQPAAKMVRAEVGKVYAERNGEDGIAAGWISAKKEHGLTIKKIKLSPVN